MIANTKQPLEIEHYEKGFWLAQAFYTDFDILYKFNDDGLKVTKAKYVELMYLTLKRLYEEKCIDVFNENGITEEDRRKFYDDVIEASFID